MKAPALPTPSMPGVAGQAGFLERWELGELSSGISQHNSRSSDSFQGASCIPLDLSGKGPACTHLYFAKSYFGGLAVTGFSDALGRNAHGAMCRVGRLIPSPDPSMVFCCAREGTLYVGLLVAHPCVTARVTRDPQRLCFDLQERYLIHAKMQDFPGLFPRAHTLPHGPKLG